MIDEYLDQLAEALNVAPRRARRILLETEDHLQQSVETRIAAGLSREQAERQAVEHFGSARMVAARFNGSVSQRAWFFRAYLYAALLGGIVLVAAGIAGEISAGFGLAFGKAYVAGDTDGVSYTPARCADYFEYAPSAATCEQAATSHHFYEIWRNADVALVFGLIVLAAHLFIRRRYVTDEDDRSFLRRMFWLTGMAGFGFIAPVLLLLGGVAGIGNDWTGQVPTIAGGLIAAVAFLVFLAPGVRNLRAITHEYAA